MQFLDTYDAILSSFPAGSFSLTAWRAYACAVSPELMAKAEEDAAKYDFEKDIRPVAEAALSHRERMERARQSFLTVTRGLEGIFREKFGLDLEVDILLYLGLCSGAGWATTLKGKAAVLLGIEKIVELNWCGEDQMRALVFHELGHIWHDAVGHLHCSSEDPKDRALWQLYQEGIAMVCEQILCGDASHYHQDRDGWLVWCLENEDLLKTEYLRRLQSGESVQDFFGDWLSFRGRSDTGYFLGCRFIRSVMARYSLVEIANLAAPELMREFEGYAGREKG